MAKLRNPLLSLGAVGRLAKDIVFARRRKVNIVESRPVPEDAKSLAQLSWRHMYLKAIALWNALDASEKQEWESLARPKHMTGFAWFISQALKPNPGLYLPLQGGTMAGNIDMATYRLLNLIDPALAQEPDTLAARLAAIAAHAALATIHQDAPNLIATHAALPNVHHTPPAGTFLGLTDTPASYSGEALKVARVNAAQNALEFASIAALSSKAISAERVMSAASGDVSYTGIGFRPTCVFCFAWLPSVVGSLGFCGSDLVEYAMARSHTDVWGAGANMIVMLETAAAGNYQRGPLKSFDADGFTITWTKAGAPLGTAVLYFLALK